MYTYNQSSENQDYGFKLQCKQNESQKLKMIFLLRTISYKIKLYSQNVKKKYFYCLLPLNCIELYTFYKYSMIFTFYASFIRPHFIEL